MNECVLPPVEDGVQHKFKWSLLYSQTHAQFQSQRSMLSRFIPLTQASKFSVCCTFHYYDKLNKTIAQRGSIFFARVSTFHCIQFLGVLSNIYYTSHSNLFGITIFRPHYPRCATSMQFCRTTQFVSHSRTTFALSPPKR